MSIPDILQPDKAKDNYVGDLGKFIQILSNAVINQETHDEVASKVIELECYDYRLFYFKGWYYYSICKEYFKAAEYITEAIDAFHLRTGCYCENAIEHLINGQPLIIITADRLYGVAGEIYAYVGKPERSLEMYALYQKEKCRIKNEEHQTLFTFRSINKHSISDIAKKQITLSHPSKFNDPFDSLILQWINHYANNSDDKPFRKIFAESYKYYRVRSFASDTETDKAISNILMWSHYADSHKGMCIEYHFSDEFIKNSEHLIRFRRVKYPIEMPKLDFDKGSIDTDLGLLTKTHCWKYENEVRLISYIDKGQEFYSINLDKASYIKAIYFGKCCNSEDIELIKSIVSSPGIQYYKIECSDEDPWNIFPVLLQ